jgi:glycosyltransferase involved in cell wall biosynthesis
MTILPVLFWFCIATVVYTYVVFPLLIAVIAKLQGHPIHPKARFTGSVSIILPFYNEAPFIARRLDELTHMLASTGLDSEIIAVSDGSTDRSAFLAQNYTERRVRAQQLPLDCSERRVRELDLPTGYPRASVHLLELPRNTGKAVALTCGSTVAVGDVIVFADARQH